VGRESKVIHILGLVVEAPGTREGNLRWRGEAVAAAVRVITRGVEIYTLMGYCRQRVCGGGVNGCFARARGDKGEGDSGGG
jgi:hypothetical protein